MQEINRPAPAKRQYIQRLTPKLKSLPVDLDNGVKLDFETARCLREYGNYHGWIVVQRREGQHVIIWRIG